MKNEKNISQIMSNGTPRAKAISAPDWFIQNDTDIDGVNTKWGPLFSEAQAGNKVEFFVTGDDYFKHVAKAIESAKKSVFIAGWQVNFDVEMDGEKTLFDVLKTAVDNGANIYIMPWLSPKVAVDTGDLETMLAISQINAGRSGPTKAFVLPAIQQSDMDGALGMFFSHHQKLVVVDNEKAYLGGIDLAYGRRDDGRFMLSADGRKGNEIYNSCVAGVKEFSAVELTQYLTRAELLAACFNDFAPWFMAAPATPIAKYQDLKHDFSEKSKDRAEQLRQWWINGDLRPEILNRLENAVQEMASDVTKNVTGHVSKWAWHQIPPDIQNKLLRLRDSGGANAADVFAAVMGWLNGADLRMLPAELMEGVGDAIQSLTIKLVRVLAVAADARETPYENLTKLKKMAPNGAFGVDDNQPRMPWQDVHSCIEGPAVYDLSMNFIKRWDSMVKRYQNSEDKVNQVAEDTINRIMEIFHIDRLIAKVDMSTQSPPAPTIPTEFRPQRSDKIGQCWVQTLRSASKTMLKDEGEKNTSTVQNNCLKAMLKAIAASQNFIYIEGQFFQSDYTKEEGYVEDIYSGPMGCLLDIRYSPGYERFAEMLGIKGLPLDEIPGKIRWHMVDDVMRERGTTNGEDFMADLKFVLGNAAEGELANKLGTVQENLKNPILQALLRRIERAIVDDLGYHVYLVLPVHPEGQLNLMNIMHQTHLTMQSLSFGKNSLVNGICRAILAGEQCRDQGIKLSEAKAQVALLSAEELHKKVGNRWRDYLTLLNLRNWETIKGRPVTEQIYVHSKLLIADDRVAILGSANINDRSQLGDRDSELAVVIKDDDSVSAPINGNANVPVSKCVHELRKNLWKKHFGLLGGKSPASNLAAVLDKPGAAETWKAIQGVADGNAGAYERAFMYIPRSEPSNSSIWPTWQYNKQNVSVKSGTLKYYMPFEEHFWREPSIRDPVHTWSATKRAPEATPQGVLGYLVSLPIAWTAGENNISPWNLIVLADGGDSSTDNQRLASLNNDNNSTG